MKDLKFPEMSKEEREKAWNELKENDIIAEVQRNYWGDSWIIKQRKVVRRTPKGFIRLDNGELLKFFESSYHIITEDFLKWYEKVQLEEDVISLISKVNPNKRKFKESLRHEDALKLKEILIKTLNN